MSRKTTTGRAAEWSAIPLKDDLTGALSWVFVVPTADGSSAMVRVSNELSTAQMVRAIRRQTTLIHQVARSATTFVDQLKLDAGPPQLETTRTGWKWRAAKVCRHRDLLAFVTPASVILVGDVPYQWSGTSTARTATIGASAGILLAYRSDLRRLIRRSNYLTFAVSCSLAALLLPWANLPEGPLFNLVGGSSTGKTLSGRAGASVQGHPDAIESWDQKPRALEEQLAARNHLLAVVNAAERCPRRERDLLIGRMAHMLPEGASTVRAAGVQDRFPDLAWQVVALSTSNASGRAMAEAAGLPWEPQDAVRFIDIPVPTIDKGGIFDRLRPGKRSIKRQAAAFVEKLETLLQSHYGVFFEPWVRYVAANDPSSLIDRYVREFLREHGSPTGIEGRIATKFGFIYAAGKIANENADLLKWPKSRVLEAVSTLYQRSRAERLGRPACPTAISEFAKHIVDPELVRRACANKTVRVRHDRDLLAIKIQHNRRSVIGLRLDGLKALMPGNHRQVRTWLQRNGVVTGGQGNKKTTQVPRRIKVGETTIEKPRLLLLHTSKLRVAFAKSGA